MDQEVWKDVIGFEGLYKVNNVGLIKSLKRVSGKYRPTKIKERILKNLKSNSGYHYVTPNRDSKKYTLRVHRLVAEAFIPNPNNKPFVNHINGIKTDNHVENLEWVTSSENNYHAYKIGLKVGCKKLKHHNLKKVIDTKTGVIYNSMIEACKVAKIKYVTFFYRLKNNKYQFQTYTK